MTDVTSSQEQEPAELSAADEQLLRELTERARTGGLQLTGEGGLLGKLTKMVIEGALEGELDDHLGYEKNDPATLMFVLLVLAVPPAQLTQPIDCHIIATSQLLHDGGSRGVP